MRVGVVGAGISGLVCAKRLLELAVPTRTKLAVTTLEWGRGPGGRTARRRVGIPHSGNNDNEDNPAAAITCDAAKTVEASFDHAAPFFSAQTSTFRNGLLREWQARGLATEWIRPGTEPTDDEDDREERVWVGLPTNHAIAKGMVQDIEASEGGSCLFGQHVQNVLFDEASRVWNVRAKDRGAGTTAIHIFDALVLSDKLLVLPNTYAVLDPSDWGALSLPPDLGSTGAVVLLMAFRRAPSVSGDALAWQRLENHPLLHTIIHDSAKPGRTTPHGLDLWVVHSTPEYAASHLVGEKLDDAEAVKHELLEASFRALAGEETSIEDLESLLAHASVMAWDHAQPNEAHRLVASHLLDAPRRAGVCGDFFLSTQCSGVEAAALSGLALAEAFAPLLLLPQTTTVDTN